MRRNKITKRLGWVAFWLLILHFVVEFTGHHYLYNTLRMTVFKGRLGPEIEEYKQMPNRQVANQDPQPWPVDQRYNQGSLSATEEAYHQLNESVAFLVIQRDTLIYERYWEHFDKDTRSNSFSMAKSIVGLLTGVAIDQGHIESVDTPVYHLLPQYERGQGEQMTIKHLLTMSAGINFDEHYMNPFAFPARANYGDDLEGLLRNYQVTTEPGVYYNYQSGTTQVLGFALMSATQTSLSDYASKHVWSKIGAENPALWSLDREGGDEKAFCCVNATARDFARIGKLYAHYGNWNGEQIVDSAYVAASIRPSGTLMADESPCKIYGYSWWLGTHERQKFFFMRGIKGQYVIVLPKQDLIVVRLGRQRHTGIGKPHPEDVYRYIDMAQRIAGYEE